MTEKATENKMKSRADESEGERWGVERAQLISNQMIPIYGTVQESLGIVKYSPLGKWVNETKWNTNQKQTSIHRKEKNEQNIKASRQSEKVKICQKMSDLSI